MWSVWLSVTRQCGVRMECNLYRGDLCGAVRLSVAGVVECGVVLVRVAASG